MTKNPTFVRKVIYLCAIAALLIPISWISRPATSRISDGNSDGGKLSQLRSEYGLSQADLGEIDPASSTMQLATLGLRGPAATLLWSRAIEFKKKENWDGLSATLNQIAKIQPHMIVVWTYQAWNLSYNVSVEFDDYRMRYHWVKKGIDFMLKGTRYNAQSPKLLNEMGWFFSHKLGRSDEHRQFRREFKIDKEFHRTLPFDTNEWDDVRQRSPDGLPDSWLVSWLWHLRAEEAAVGGDGNDVGNPLVFYSRAPMALMYYPQAIEEEGIHGEYARQAWREAGEAWHEYGDRPLRTSLGDRIQLNNLDFLNKEITSLEAQLKELAPGVEEEILAELTAELSPAEREAFETVRELRTPDQYELAAQAERALEFSPRLVAERAPENVRDQAMTIADLLIQKKVEAIYTNRYRQQINYPYWVTRAEIEQGQNAVAAREHLYEADQHFRAAQLDEARARYEKAWALWAEIFEKYPSMLEDTTAEDLMEAVHRYERLLAQHDESFPPEDFPLMDLLQVQDPDFAVPPGSSTEEAEAEETAPVEDSTDTPSDEAAPASDEAEPAPATSEEEDAAATEEEETAPAAEAEASQSPESDEAEPASAPAPAQAESAEAEPATSANQHKRNGISLFWPKPLRRHLG